MDARDRNRACVFLAILLVNVAFILGVVVERSNRCDVCKHGMPPTNGSMIRWRWNEEVGNWEWYYRDLREEQQ